MLNSEDFELPLESKLKLRVLTDEIEKCDDIKALRKNLSEVTTLLVRYQRILNGLMKRQIENEVSHMLGFVENDKLDKDT